MLIETWLTPCSVAANTSAAGLSTNGDSNAIPGKSHPHQPHVLERRQLRRPIAPRACRARLRRYPPVHSLCAAREAQGRPGLTALPGPLLRLLARCEGVDLAFDATSYVPDCHIQVPMLSLPAIFGTTIETVPAKVPISRATPCWSSIGALSWPRPPGRIHPIERVPARPQGLS